MTQEEANDIAAGAVALQIAQLLLSKALDSGAVNRKEVLTALQDMATFWAAPGANPERLPVRQSAHELIQKLLLHHGTPTEGRQ